LIRRETVHLNHTAARLSREVLSGGGRRMAFPRRESEKKREYGAE